jgi:hypothetical protein
MTQEKHYRREDILRLKSIDRSTLRRWISAGQRTHAAQRNLAGIDAGTHWPGFPCRRAGRNRIAVIMMTPPLLQQAQYSVNGALLTISRALPFDKDAELEITRHGAIDDALVDFARLMFQTGAVHCTIHLTQQTVTISRLV